MLVITGKRTADMEENDFDEPCYVISIAARLVGMHAQTLRQYERIGLVEPKRSRGNIRLYSQSDVARLRQVQRLISDLGVNLAGVEVVLRMNERMQAMEAEMEALRREVKRLHDGRLRESDPGRGGRDGD